MRQRFVLPLLTLGAALMIAGGAGDLLLRRPPAAWDAVVGAPVASLPPGASVLLLTLLHTLGGALVACGLAVLGLAYGPLRRGERWAGPLIATVALLSDGLNAWGMARLGLGYFWAPLAFAGLVLFGVLLAFFPTPVFPAAATGAAAAGRSGRAV